jgi:biotin synthase
MTDTTVSPQPVHLVRRSMPAAPVAERWPREAVLALFEQPFNDLLHQAQQVHRQHFDPNEVQRSTLLSIKTGGCPEDCGYCPQSVHYDTGVEAGKLLDADEVRRAAQAAKAQGASRFCMGAAWRAPKDRDVEKVAELVRTVKDLGLEACCTLGMLTDTQARTLKDAGLDYYNHNLDTAPEAYGRIISTRDYQDRLDTLEHVRSAGMHVCSGGIVGMGESREERAGLIAQLANMDHQPPGAGGRHAAARPGPARPARVRAHHRRGTHHHAHRPGAPVGRSPADERGRAGAVLPGGGQFHLLRRQAADHRQSRLGARSAPVRQAGAAQHLTRTGQRPGRGHAIITA